MGMHIPVRILAFNSCGYTPRSGVADRMATLYVSFFFLFFEELPYGSCCVHFESVSPTGFIFGSTGLPAGCLAQEIRTHKGLLSCLRQLRNALIPAPENLPQKTSRNGRQGTRKVVISLPYCQLISQEEVKTKQVTFYSEEPSVLKLRTEDRADLRASGWLLLASFLQGYLGWPSLRQSF